jgi:hypothetical protein
MPNVKPLLLKSAQAPPYGLRKVDQNELIGVLMELDASA